LELLSFFFSSSQSYAKVSIKTNSTSILTVSAVRYSIYQSILIIIQLFHHNQIIDKSQLFDIRQLIWLFTLVIIAKHTHIVENAQQLCEHHTVKDIYLLLPSPPGVYANKLLLNGSSLMAHFFMVIS